MKRTIISILAFSIIASATLFLPGAAAQTINPVGRYVYKTHREGRGGFHNVLEITRVGAGRFHVSFEGTYFYLAGRDETFHEGSGEGEGRLTGNILTATLSDGVACRLTMTFNLGQITVRAFPNCRLNVDPAGIYKKEVPAQHSPGPKTVSRKLKVLDVCPDPKALCRSVMHEFAAYELPFRLPARSRRGRIHISAPFYAVIVKTYDMEDCDAEDHTTSIESERQRLQKIYPTRKVFGSYSCPNLDAVDYDFPGKWDRIGERALIPTFIAVYAGQSPAEANEFLSYAQTLFPQALLKRMTVNYEIIDQ